MKKTLIWAVLTLFVGTTTLVAWTGTNRSSASPVKVTTTTVAVQQINHGAAEATVAAAQAYLAGLEAAQLEAFYEEQARLEAVRLENARKAQEAKEAQARASAAQSTQSAPQSVSGGSGGVWDRLAQCESGGNWGYPPVSGGFSGGIMFHIGTWRAMGGTAYAPDAYLASREAQIAVAEKVLAVSGWGAWPGCSSKLGLR